MNRPDKLDAKYWNGIFLQYKWDREIKIYIDQLEEERKALIEYVKHEMSCKCIENYMYESNCDCGLYELIKNDIRH